MQRRPSAHTLSRARFGGDLNSSHDAARPSFSWEYWYGTNTARIPGITGDVSACAQREARARTCVVPWRPHPPVRRWRKFVTCATRKTTRGRADTPRMPGIHMCRNQKAGVQLRPAPLLTLRLLQLSSAVARTATPASREDHRVAPGRESERVAVESAGGDAMHERVRVCAARDVHWQAAAAHALCQDSCTRVWHSPRTCVL